MSVIWTDDRRLSITPPKKPKKITGTRLGAILGVNPWASAFEAWCAITRTWEEPFEDTKYTIAGKTIEPKQAKYIEDNYYVNLLSPTDKYGKDYFKKTYGDFFKDEPIFGGMWDYLLLNEEGDVDGVLEMKTTKRSEDWKDGVPEYYALQAALYAYLLHVDNVYMVASFLEEKDYEDPSAYECTPKNTTVIAFKVSDRYPDFAETMGKVEEWWEKFVLGGISPQYDEKKDADALAALRKNTVSPETELSELIEEAGRLTGEINEVTASIAALEKRLSKLKEMIKTILTEKFRDGDTKVEAKQGKYTFTLSKQPTTTIDKKALEEDGLLSKYTVNNVQYRLTMTEEKEK